MRSIESIQESHQKWGYAHLKRSEYSREEVEKSCRESGWKLTGESCYHFTVEPSEAPAVSGTDWEEVRKNQFNRRQKLAAARKKKEQNT